MDLTHATLTQLAEQHGDGFHLLDVAAFRRDCTALLSAFQDRYPSTVLAYSYKTNYLPPVLREVQRLGGLAEVVSGMEYELARRLAVPPERILFNGPYKTAEQVVHALGAGSTVNLDGLHELDLVEQAADRFPGRPLHVALRCNLGLGTRPSRFGFDVDGADLPLAVQRLLQIPGVELLGLHCHASTGDRSAAACAERTRALIRLSAALLPRPPRTLNVGGGFFSPVGETLRAQLDVVVPTYEEYADAVAGEMARAYPHDDGPLLLLEPGTAVVARALAFAARVVAVKEVRGRRLALVAGSVHNVKPTLHDKRLTARVLRPEGAGEADQDGGGPVDVVGYTCMEHDVLVPDCPGPVEVGDVLLVEEIGAYTVVLQPPFIQPAPPVVAHDGDVVTLARRREEPRDLFATYCLD